MLRVGEISQCFTMGRPNEGEAERDMIFVLVVILKPPRGARNTSERGRERGSLDTAGWLCAVLSRDDAPRISFFRQGAIDAAAGHAVRRRPIAGEGQV